MKIYISGPMTGIEDFNKKAFNYWANKISFRGHEAVNPATLPTPITPDWTEYMKQDIKALLDCDAVLCLPGWQFSRGAKIEINLAVELGLKVFEALDLQNNTVCLANKELLRKGI